MMRNVVVSVSDDRLSRHAQYKDSNSAPGQLLDSAVCAVLVSQADVLRGGRGQGANDPSTDFQMPKCIFTIRTTVIHCFHYAPTP